MVALWTSVIRAGGALAIVSLAQITHVVAQSAAPSTIGVSEIKAGALYHDVPGLWSGFSVERPAVDANFEVLFNAWGRAFGGTIKPAIGTTLNFEHDTSKAYADLRWEYETAAGAFVAFGMGAAIHNGQLGGTDAMRKALGSPVLFHPSAEIGFRFDGANSASLFADHMSNGFSRRDNGGMDTIGVRLGHRFAAASDREQAGTDGAVARFGGFFTGALVGYRRNEVDWNAGSAVTAHASGGLAGGFVGYNWQSGHGVFGVEADASQGAGSTGTDCGLASLFCQLSVRGIYSVRPRFGWVVGQTLFYGTGGLAVATWDASFINRATGQQLAAARTTNYGVTVGVGVERKLNAHLVGRAEVTHTGLQGNDLATSVGTAVFNQFQMTTGRVGLAWYFN